MCHHWSPLEGEARWGMYPGLMRWLMGQDMMGRDIVCERGGVRS